VRACANVHDALGIDADSRLCAAWLRPGVKTLLRGRCRFVALRWVAMFLIALAPCAWAADPPPRPPEVALLAADTALAAVVEDLEAFSKLPAGDRAAFRLVAATPE
jgi:hypothetical protein